MTSIVGLGEYVISKNVEETIKIFALASCIGLVVYDKKSRLTAAAHILLPDSTINPELSKVSPAYFADTGVELLMREFANGHGIKPHFLEVGIYGGAKSAAQNDVFDIGQRNIAAVKEALAKYGVVPSREEVGGNYSRNIEVIIKTGEVVVARQEYGLAALSVKSLKLT